MEETVEPKHTINICMAGACQRNFCKDSVKAAEKELGIELNQVTPDGKIALSQCGCLGNCSKGPSAMIDGNLYGGMLPRQMKNKIREMKDEQ